MISLDEGIKYAENLEEVLKSYPQFVEWLKELNNFRKVNGDYILVNQNHFKELCNKANALNQVRVDIINYITDGITGMQCGTIPVKVVMDIIDKKISNKEDFCIRQEEINKWTEALNKLYNKEE